MLIAASLILSGAAAAAAAATPHRIVSANLCADRLVLQLADRADIVSVSRLATDPELSTVVKEAAGIRQNRADAEEIVSLHPDLVLLASPQTSAAVLRSLGINVHVIPVGDGIQAVEAAIRGVAAALGVPARGEAMIAAMEARFAALPVRQTGARAAVYLAGGWSSGSGTLADDLLTRAGFVNIAALSGLEGFDALPLETLVAARPDLLVFEAISETGPSLADALLENPVLRATGARILRMPARLWACPDPAVAEAAALIADAAP